MPADIVRCFWCGSDEVVQTKVINRPDLISVSMDCAEGHRSTMSWAPGADPGRWVVQESWKDLAGGTPSPQQSEVAMPTPYPTERRE